MTESPTINNIEDQRIASFEQLKSSTLVGQPDWLLQLRNKGIDRYSELGYPTIKDEDWRFTNVSAISKLILFLLQCLQGKLKSEVWMMFLGSFLLLLWIPIGLFLSMGISRQIFHWLVHRTV